MLTNTGEFILILGVFTVMLNLPRITAYVVNSHALHTIYLSILQYILYLFISKNRIASLLCIFETTIVYGLPLILTFSYMQINY